MNLNMNKKKEEKMAKTKGKDNIIIVSILLAMVAAGIIFAVMLNIEKNIMSNYEKGNVVVTTTQVPEGLILTEENVSKYFAVKEIEKNNIADSAYLKLEDLYGLITTNAMDKDMMATYSLFAECNEITEEAGKKVYLSFSVSQVSQAVNGTLRSGDRIDIYGSQTNPESQKTEIYTKDEWKNVLVYATYDTSGANVANNDNTAVAQLITVMVNREDVNNFLDGLYDNSIKVVKITK